MSTARISDVVAPEVAKPQGMRKNGMWIPNLQAKDPILNFFLGKQWHAPRSAFRPKAGNSTFEKRNEHRRAMATVKAKEKEMKEEKEAERQVCEAHFGTLLFRKATTIA